MCENKGRRGGDGGKESHKTAGQRERYTHIHTAQYNLLPRQQLRMLSISLLSVVLPR